MSLTAVELGRRLRLARERAGLKQDDIAKALEITRAAVSQIEGGQRAPNSLQLARIADLVGEDVGALLGADEYKPDHSFAALFRVSDATRDDRSQHTALRECARISNEFSGLEDLLGIDRRENAPAAYDLPSPDSKWAAVRQGEALADQERSRMKLGESAVRDVVELLEAHGVRAFELALPDGVSGLSLTDRAHGPCVIIAAGEPCERQRFSYAHEYCHLLADRGREPFVSRTENPDDLREMRANAFAASFLLPQGGVRATLAIVGKGDVARSVLTAAFDGANAVAGQKRVPAHAIQVYDVVHVAAAFGVSYGTALYRLENLGLLSKDERLALDAHRKSAATLRALWGGDSAPSRVAGWKRDSRHRFVQLGLECVRRELISRRKFDELRRLVGVSDKDAAALLEALRPRAVAHESRG